MLQRRILLGDPLRPWGCITIIQGKYLARPGSEDGLVFDDILVVGITCVTKRLKDVSNLGLDW